MNVLTTGNKESKNDLSTSVGDSTGMSVLIGLFCLFWPTLVDLFDCGCLSSLPPLEEHVYAGEAFLP